MIMALRKAFKLLAKQMKKSGTHSTLEMNLAVVFDQVTSLADATNLSRMVTLQV